jgi:hypothetical protein
VRVQIKQPAQPAGWTHSAAQWVTAARLLLGRLITREAATWPFRFQGGLACTCIFALFLSHARVHYLTFFPPSFSPHLPTGNPLPFSTPLPSFPLPLSNKQTVSVQANTRILMSSPPSFLYLFFLRAVDPIHPHTLSVPANSGLLPGGPPSPSPQLPLSSLRVRVVMCDSPSRGQTTCPFLPTIRDASHVSCGGRRREPHPHLHSILPSAARPMR